MKMLRVILLLLILVSIVSCGLGKAGNPAGNTTDDKMSLSNPGIFATKLEIYTPGIEGRPVIKRYDIKNVSVNTGNSTCLTIKTTDGKSVYATSYLIDDDTIYIKY